MSTPGHAARQSNNQAVERHGRPRSGTLTINGGSVMARNVDRRAWRACFQRLHPTVDGGVYTQTTGSGTAAIFSSSMATWPGQILVVP